MAGVKYHTLFTETGEKCVCERSELPFFWFLVFPPGHETTNGSDSYGFLK